MYEFRLDGYLDTHWSAWFGAKTMARNDDGTTLCGPLIDQSDLHGLLAKVRDLGATLLSVFVIEAVDLPLRPHDQSTGEAIPSCVDHDHSP